jgi:hypothetical protein
MGRPELRGCAHNARRQLATLREKILEWFVFVAPFSASRFYRFGLCGICGQPSDTSEHRIKKSDLVQQYGTGPYRGTETLMHFKAGRVSKVQGPDSALVKYRKDLCGQCNSSFTKPFDLAYEQFIAWTMTNDEEVLRHRVIDFEPVFGHEWEKSSGTSSSSSRSALAVA